MTVTFTKLEGDRESKACDILRDGVRIGSIEVLNDEGFQSAASRRRVMRFDSVEVYLLDGSEKTFTAAEGFTSRTAVKAAKQWALEQASK